MERVPKPGRVDRATMDFGTRGGCRATVGSSTSIKTSTRESFTVIKPMERGCTARQMERFLMGTGSTTSHMALENRYLKMVQLLKESSILGPSVDLGF